MNTTVIETNPIILLKKVWTKAEKQFFRFALYLMGVIILTGFADEYLIDSKFFLLSLLGFIIMIIYPWMILGIMRMALKILDGKKISISDFNFEFVMIVKYVILSIINALIVLGGLVLLIFPGIILSVAVSQSAWIYVDERLPIFESIKKSFQITYGYKWTLFLWVIYLIVLNLLGSAALGIGIFITVPLSILIMAYIYRILSGKIVNIESKSEVTVKKVKKTTVKTTKTVKPSTKAKKVVKSVTKSPVKVKKLKKK